MNVCREQIAMSRGLMDVPMVVVANKTDLVSRDSDTSSDKNRHDIVNKVLIQLFLENELTKMFLRHKTMEFHLI